MSTQLALEAEWWLRQMNVEEVLCWLPSFDQVCDGTHTVTAVGNDGMAVNIAVDNAAVQAAAASGRYVAELAQLAHLGRLLRAFRRQESVAEA